MNINGAFPSDYLKAADLGGRSFELVMGKVTVEKIGDDTRPILHFQNAQKALVLNRTNANTIEDLYGQETDNWIGRPIDVYPSVTDFRGDRVDCIRVKRSGPPLAETLPPAKPAPSAEPEAPISSLDDDIPF